MTASAIRKPTQLDITTGISEWIGSGQIKMTRGFTTTTEISLDTHEHLFLSGDEHTHVYQVLEGVVGLYRMLADGRRQIVSFYYPGDLIGVVDQTFSQHHAEALCDTRVRCIPAKTIETLMASEPGFVQALLNTMATELAETRDQVLSLGRKSALEKLATFLLRISGRNAREKHDELRLHLPVTRSEIGDYLGLTIETVSRNITKLRAAGVINLERKSVIQIIDLQKLNDIADGGC